MNFFADVAKINADIAALPKEYHALIVAEQTWVAKHPDLANVAKVGAGIIIGFLMSLFF